MTICDQLIQELDSARARMQALVVDLDPAYEVYPGWTVKELLAHITGWDDLIINTINRHLTGQAPILSVNRGIDFYNASTVSERSGLPYEHILREYTATREQLKGLLRSVPPERFLDEIILPWGPRGQLAKFILIFSNHEIEHEEEILAHLRGK